MHRYVLSFLLLTLGFTAGAQFGRYFEDATLRFDYYHSGSIEAE